MREISLAGRYRLVEVLSRQENIVSAMATDEVLGRPVIARILKQGVPEELISTFKDSALRWAALTHPNIATVYDAGMHRGLEYLVSEFVPEGTLTDKLARGPLDPMRVCVIGDQLCAALSAASAAGVHHGHITADNVLITESGQVRLTDFGVHAALAGVAASPADDIRGVGETLFRALTGRALSECPTNSPRDQRPEVPRFLDEAIVRATSENGYQDAAEFAAALGAAAHISAPARVDRADEDVTASTAEPTSFLRSEARLFLTIALIVAVAAGIVLAIPTITRNIAPTPQATPTPVVLRAVGSGIYDPPPGDGHENDELVSLALDGDRRSAWRTDRYGNASFGSLKSGVGIWVDLGKPRRVTQVIVHTGHPGWLATLRYSEDSVIWTDPGASEEVEDGHAFSVNQTHRYVMLWITRVVPVEPTGKNPFQADVTKFQALGAGAT